MIELRDPSPFLFGIVNSAFGSKVRQPNGTAEPGFIALDKQALPAVCMTRAGDEPFTPTAVRDAAAKAFQQCILLKSEAIAARTPVPQRPTPEKRKEVTSACRWSE